MKGQLTQSELRRDEMGAWQTGHAVVTIYPTGLRPEHEMVACEDKLFDEWNFSRG